MEPHAEQPDELTFPPGTPEWIKEFRRKAVAAVRAEVEEMNRGRAAPAIDRRRRRRAGPSVVLSVRMDPQEFAALERRAMATGLSSSGLARNLIRSGLGQPASIGLADVACELEAMLDRLREAVV